MLHAVTVCSPCSTTASSNTRMIIKAVNKQCTNNRHTYNMQMDFFFVLFYSYETSIMQTNINVKKKKQHWFESLYVLWGFLEEPFKRLSIPSAVLTGCVFTVYKRIASCWQCTSTSFCCQLLTCDTLLIPYNPRSIITRSSSRDLSSSLQLFEVSVYREFFKLSLSSKQLKEKCRQFFNIVFQPYLH